MNVTIKITHFAFPTLQSISRYSEKLVCECTNNPRAVSLLSKALNLERTAVKLFEI